MSQKSENFKGVVCHADDILVFGRDRQEYDKRLHKVLQKMQLEGLTLHEKCKFAKDKITELEPDPNKVKANKAYMCSGCSLTVGQPC